MKKRTWIFLVFYLLATLWPVIGQAQVPIVPIQPPALSPNQQAPSALSLTPPDTDLSVGYLSNIFGTVDGVLSGTGSQLLGAMFGIFNGAVLVLGGIVILYTLFISTIKTAHEGEVLGRQWSSVWIPLRSVISIALLIPKASGYSFIQIFMMWVVVMGVGAADSVWNTALDYFLRGGILMQQNTALSQITNGGPKLMTGSANLLRMLTCTQMLQNRLEAYRQSQLDNPSQVTVIPVVPNFYQGIQSSITSQVNASTVTVIFPTSGYKVGAVSTDGVCGYMTWSAPAPSSTTGLSPQSVQQIQQSRSLAVQAMVTQLYGAAAQIVLNGVKTPDTSRFELGHILNNMVGTQTYLWGAGTLAKPTNPLLAGTTLSDAATSYFGIMGPTLNYINNAQQFQGLADKWISQAKAQGWVIAGSYYFAIINDLNKGMTIEENNPPTFDATSILSVLSSTQNLFLGGTYAKDIDDLVNGTQPYDIGASSRFLTDAQTYGNSLTYGQIGVTIPGGPAGSGNGNADQLVKSVTGAIGPVFKQFADLANAQKNNLNPITMLASLGALLVNITTGVFITLAIVVFGISFGLGLAWGFTFVVAMVAMLMPILALFTPVLLSLMVAGLVMSLYIPIIPFIIFTFGVIGWFIAVIEAIIAAPLVALGIAHPEGQEILGKAEPAVGLLVNVFLRPTFMIFGLLIGMMLSYVAIWILNIGFWSAYQNVQNLTSGPGFMGMFSGLAALVIYTLLVMQVVQKSFSLIYIIPDEVLKWIGIQVKGMGGEAEAERAVAGGAHQAAETGGKAVSGGAEASQGSASAGVKAKKATEAYSHANSPDDSPAISGTPGSGPASGGNSAQQNKPPSPGNGVNMKPGEGGGMGGGSTGGGGTP